MASHWNTYTLRIRKSEHASKSISQLITRSISQSTNQDEPKLSCLLSAFSKLKTEIISPYSRNKILTGDVVFKYQSDMIRKKYTDLGPDVPCVVQRGKTVPKYCMAPSFRQFVQSVLDEAASGSKLNEHWIPQATFCTPCLANFTVLAKVTFRKQQRPTDRKINRWIIILISCFSCMVTTLHTIMEQLPYSDYIFKSQILYVLC